MNTQFATNVHTFTSDVLDLLFEQFEGKTVGGEEEDSVSKEEMMKSLFGDYKPGKAGKVKKSKKKKSSGGTKKKLSGYTFFGAMNKEEVNKEINETAAETGEKPKYVSIVGKRWKALSEEEQEEWKTDVKGYNLFVDENEGGDVTTWKELSDEGQDEWKTKASPEEIKEDDEVEEKQKQKQKKKSSKKVKKKVSGSDEEDEEE